MKTTFVLIISLLSCTVQGQQTTRPVWADSIDTAIEKTILNYIENFFENNFDEMNNSLHPRLAKRGLNPDGTLSDDFPPEKLKELMSSKQKFPLAHQNNVVENISVFGNMASATLITGYPKLRWVENIHLVKIDGDWKIINVFWEFGNKKP